MGDRSNVKITYEDGNSIHFYAHWSGPSVLESVEHALRSGRVSDPAYFARILFCHMVKDDVEGETGFGISPWVSDNEYPIVVIDFKEGERKDRAGIAGFQYGSPAVSLSTVPGHSVNPERWLQMWEAVTSRTGDPWSWYDELERALETDRDNVPQPAEAATS